MYKKLITLVLSGFVLFTFSQTNEFKFNIDIHTDTVCSGDEVLLTVNILSGVPPFQFKDDQGNIVSLPLKVYLDSTSVITIYGKDAIASTWSDNIKINIYKKPKIEIKSDVISGCQPLEVNFNEETSNSENRKYYWSFSDGGLSFDKNANHVFEDYGLFDVSLEVRESHGNKVCKNKENAIFQINVFEKPESKFDIDEDVQSSITPTFYFNNLSDESYFSFWDFGDQDSSILFSPNHSYTQIGTYKITLITVSDNECRDTAISFVTVQPQVTFFEPDAFTPDNDGVNDLFLFKASELNLDKFEFKVYDRGGHVIWETNDINEGWDGNVYGGRIGKPGIYVYTVVLVDYKGVEFTKSGTINLIR